MSDDRPYVRPGRPRKDAPQREAFHADEDARLADIETAANLLADRLAAAPAPVVESIFAGEWWQPEEPVEVVRNALLADVEPMSFTGMAFFILDALAVAGYCVTLSEGPIPLDRAGEADGPATVAPRPAPSSTAAPSLLGTGRAGAAVGPSSSEEVALLPCPADGVASSGASSSGGAS